MHLLLSQGGSSEIKAAWPALPTKLTLLGIAYAGGGIRICTAALFELLRLSPSQLAALDLPAADAAAAGPQISQASCASGGRPIVCLAPHVWPSGPLLHQFRSQAREAICS